MNGIENIKNLIMDEAASLAKDITEQAAAQADAAADEARAAAEKEKVALLEKGKKEAQLAYDRITSAGGSRNRLAVLSAKQQIIDEVFESVMSRLDDMEGDAYKALLVRLISENAAGGEELLFPASDADIAEEVMQLAAAQSGKSFVLSGEAAPFKKGVLIRNGSQEVNCSLRNIAQFYRDEYSGIAAGILFDGK